MEPDCRLSSVRLAKHHLVRTLVPSRSNGEYRCFSIYLADSDVSVGVLRILFQTMNIRGNNGYLPERHVVLVCRLKRLAVRAGLFLPKGKNAAY